MLALSIVIFAPIFQLGCFRAFLGLRLAIFLGLFISTTAPPDAVIISFFGSASLLESKNFKPKCSLSIGVILVVSKKAPPATKLSLFAKARLNPSSCASLLGTSPPKPTSAFISVVLLESHSLAQALRNSLISPQNIRL